MRPLSRAPARLYTYDQLKLVNPAILKTRARELKDLLKKEQLSDVPKTLAAELRTHAETEVVIQWCARRNAQLPAGRCESPC